MNILMGAQLMIETKMLNIPTKQAQLRGYRFFFGDGPITIINIGSHGFSVMEVRANRITMFHENNRCSQGTGNFLSQFVERFSLTVLDNFAFEVHARSRNRAANAC
jgi:activator of 2-hydroxyglutaryl-CoA dehydratase